MLLLTLFLTIISIQFIAFMLASFPILAVTNGISTKTEFDQLMAKIDKVIVDRACNITAGCGECRTITDDGGVIVSPNFPDEYDPNLNCLYTLKAPLGMKIRLTFTEFLVNKCCDFITVFDGLANPLQIAMNGQDIPPPVMSPSNRMAIKFTTSVDHALINATKDAEPARWQAIYTFV
ncbi:tolloid-like protein 2 [Daphnia carinata]|uniref:tolloid-like protein 2 n=1 Tax=Daphnia carinata TaxID=120202 RepID=UPI00257AD96E|nr:tolloid-like protein 2 [Daphnia carinata]